MSVCMFVCCGAEVSKLLFNGCVMEGLRKGGVWYPFPWMYSLKWVLAVEVGVDDGVVCVVARVWIVTVIEGYSCTCMKQTALGLSLFLFDTKLFMRLRCS